MTADSSASSSWTAIGIGSAKTEIVTETASAWAGSRRAQLGTRCTPGCDAANARVHVHSGIGVCDCANVQGERGWTG